MTLPSPVTVTLVTGPSAGVREQAVFAQLQLSNLHHDSAKSGVILEGLAPGNSPLDTLPAHVLRARIAPGCLCCTGNLVLRVTLNRMLRQRPEHLFIVVARSEHLDQLRSWLQAEPYDQLLRLTPDLKASS
ncbi:GTPase [Massilia norwichensis]|uniref:GTPase n=1 Tax=Massilia norwichensis TaxID=1442366 RepID=A0ABT2ACJ9_9BURK|nr:GTPase [Massilia norwichensis]MCS0591902.1 GTPase [Massilia norwichensis]